MQDFEVVVGEMEMSRELGPGKSKISFAYLFGWVYQDC